MVGRGKLRVTIGACDSNSDRAHECFPAGTLKELLTMKYMSPTLPTIPPLPTPGGAIDTATLKLLASWKAEDATTDPEQLREADEEVAEFKKAMNENRAATGARLLFP